MSGAPKNNEASASLFFIQAAVGVPRSELAELWGFPYAWHIISPFGAVSHHAIACILLRLDEIQHCVLVIYRNKLRIYVLNWSDAVFIASFFLIYAGNYATM